MHFKSNFLRLISLLSLVTLVVFSILNLPATAQTEEEVKAIYDTQKVTIQSQLDSISGQLDEIGSQWQQNTQIQLDLTQESAKVKSEINTINALITDTKIVISQIEKQMQIQQKEIDEKKNEIKEVNREIQTYSITPKMRIFFSGENLGDVLSNFYKVSSLRERAQELKNQQESKQRILQDTRDQNEQIKDQLERTRALIKAKQSNYDSMLAYTNGKVSELDSLIQAMKDQKVQLDAQIGGLEGDYLAEIDQLRTDANRKNVVDTNCTFEDNQLLDVPKGYFTRPAIGWQTQPFHCAHDGVDIANSLGTDIMSVADGMVVKVGPRMNGCVGFGCSGGFGNYVIIKHTLPSGQTVYSLYAHMQNVSNVSVGQNVNQGQTIGKMGCTGYTLPFPCGVHLHFMLISNSVDTYGLGCRLGRNKCYNPAIYINPLS